MSYEVIRLEPHTDREKFTCDDEDLDEFYQIDSGHYAAELYSVTYTVCDNGKTIGFFSLSNDAIRKDIVPKKAYNRITRKISNQKRLMSLPATKIGRLGVCLERQGTGVGTYILDFLKYSFTHANKTGCRFLLVDAYNKPDTLQFYEKNGFEFLPDDETKAKTRIMYFDLKWFRDPGAPESRH